MGDSCLSKRPIKVLVLENRQYLDHMSVFYCVSLALHCLSDSTEKRPLRARCPVLPKTNCDGGFLGGLISEKNSLLGPSVSYGAEP